MTHFTPLFDRLLATNRGRSLVHSYEHSLGRHGFRECCGCFSRIKKLLGRSETRTRERKCFQLIRTVETYPETIDQELRSAVCELRKTDLRTIIVSLISGLVTLSSSYNSRM